MILLICLSVLSGLIYPATLSAFGLTGNAYILRNQMKEAKDDLGGQIQEIKADLKGLKQDMKGLTARQREMELSMYGCGGAAEGVQQEEIRG